MALHQLQHDKYVDSANSMHVKLWRVQTSHFSYGSLRWPAD
jgi:hypothetical protein